MKTHYLQKSRKSFNGRNRLAVIVFVIGVFVYYCSALFFPALLPSSLHVLGTPLWNIRLSVKRIWSDRVDLLNSKRGLIEKNTVLRKELERFVAENIELRALVQHATMYAFPTTTRLSVPVLVRPPQSLYDTLIVGKGVEDGVKVGDFVFYGKGILVGEISRSLPTTAEVRLFSSGGVTSVIKSPDGAEYSAEGRGAGSYVLKVPHDSSLKVGDILVKPGPLPLIVGTVETIVGSETDSFKDVYFKLPFNLFTVSWLEVALQKTNE